jgi:maleylacetoacetate isomerase
MLLYDYYRSSAAYRVRIALNLKGVEYTRRDLRLLDNEQSTPEHLARNPQGLVPALEADGRILTQSLAIIDWLDAKHPEPRLIPVDPDARAAALAQALVVACDIHPLNNLRVMRYLGRELEVDEDKRGDWTRHWIAEGFGALEAMAGDGPFLGGAAPGIADVFLVPQMFNARRFSLDLDAYPKLVAADWAMGGLDAVKAAHPEVLKPAA